MRNRRFRNGFGEITFILVGTGLLLGIFIALSFHLRLGKVTGRWNFSRAAAEGDLARLERLAAGASEGDLVEALGAAVRHDRASATSLLLGKVPLDQRASLSWLLMWAARGSSLELFALLEKEGVRFTASFPARLYWPLEEFRLFTSTTSPVSTARRLAMVSLLRDRGALPDARSLHWAAARNLPEMVAPLVAAGCFRDSTMRRREHDDSDNPFHGMTPLRIAAQCGSYETALELLKAGASPITLSQNGKTALDVAVADGNFMRTACSLSTNEPLSDRQRKVVREYLSTLRTLQPGKREGEER